MTRAGKNRLVISVVISILFSIPMITQNLYYLHILIQIFIWVVLSTSLFVVLRTGVFNFGYAAFIGVGAYTTSILMVREGFSFWTTLPLSGAAAVIVSIVIGLPILRAKGMYFVLLSASLCEILKLAIANSSYAGGWSGLYGISAPRLLSINFSNKIAYYYLVLAFMILCMFILNRLWNCRIGKIFRAISVNEALAASVGIPLARYKIMSLAITSCFGALGGSFLVPVLTSIEPNQFGFMTTATCFLYMVIGGMGSIIGPAIGAMVGIVIDEALSFMLALRPVVFGVLVILMIIFMRDRGLISLPGKVKEFLKGKKDLFVEKQEG